MKLHTLMMAVALVAGSALAQAPYGTAKAPADTSASTAAAADTASPTHKLHKKKLAKKAHAHQHASANHHGHHMHASAMHREHHMHAAAHMRHTSAMGAGPARRATDLDARTRQERMDRAYADWQARR
jgi:hypothetical protein